MGALRALRDYLDIIGLFFFLKIVKRIDRAESTTGYSDLQSLYLAARDGRGEGDIAELGSYKGKSSIALALGSRAGKRRTVYCVDPHSEGTREIFLKNLRGAGCLDRIEPVVAASQDAAAGFRRQLRLIFIDGNHEYDFVRRDIELWKGHVCDGGIIAFHDFTFPGVRRAIAELLPPGEYTPEISAGCTLFVSKGKRQNKRLFEKIARFNRLKNALFLLKGKKLPESECAKP